MWRDAAAIARGHSPRQVVLQLTDRCNAACPQCSMRASNPFPRTHMSRPLAARIVDHAAEIGVSGLSITGGEPLLCAPDVQFLIRRATAAGIRHTRTGTNGFLFTGSESPSFSSRIARLVEGLVSSGLRNFWISLDSADAGTHERIRGLPGVVAGIEKALPLFHDAGLYPAVNLGLTRRFGGAPLPPLWDVGPAAFAAAARTGLTAFFSRAVDLGFTMASVCYPMSVGAKDDGLVAAYLATAGAPIVRFTARERFLLYSMLGEVVTEQRSRIRVFTPLSSVTALVRQHGSEPVPLSRGDEAGHACRGGVDYFFVDAHGETFPCGYRGTEWLGQFTSFSPPRRATPACRRCDWECFRDPSELLGPVTAPGRRRLLTGLLSGSEPALRRWRDDVRYARACGLFDGRRPLDPERLRRFVPAPPDETRRRPAKLEGRRSAAAPPTA